MTFENLCEGVARGAPDLDTEKIQAALRKLGISIKTGAFPRPLDRAEIAVITYLIGYAAGIAGLERSTTILH